MGQNESRSTTTTTAVTPVVTPSKSRFLAVVHHPPSSEMSNDLNNKTCNTTTKFLGMYANLIIFFIFQQPTSHTQQTPFWVYNIS